jgi:S-formylglutathione hydrolase
MTKAGAQGWAAEEGIAVIFPDTSPRGEGVADDPAYDLGQGAGFYVNASEAPWAPHFRMWDYVVDELPALVFGDLPLDAERQGITGHSMGGHGALTIAMTRPDTYRSLSAISPIANPMRSDWGRKQLSAYLGGDEAPWAAHDASVLMAEKGYPDRILVDQGAKDQFLDLLKPEALVAAAAGRRQPMEFRMLAGYDHSYFYVASVMEDHVRWHAANLLGGAG